MKLQFLGTGSCMPSPKVTNKPFRSYTGWYVEIGNDSLLFDIGAGSLVKLCEKGVDIMKNPTHLFISHFHPDHCSDIIALMQGRGVSNVNYHNIAKMFVAGPAGLQDFCKNIFEGVEKWHFFMDEVKIYDLLQLKEVTSGLVEENPNWKVSCLPIKHFDGNCYRLDVGGKSIVYSGDMAYDENIAVLGKDADIAIMECSYPDRETLKGLHLCPEDIGKLAKLGNFKHVILTHMYPACEGREKEMIEKIKSIAQCEVTIAEDLQEIEV